MLDFIPAPQRYVIERVKAESTTPSGLEIPAVAQREKWEGIVVATGDLQTYQVGDHVLYSQFGGVSIVLFNKPYILLHENEILGRFREPDEEGEEDDLSMFSKEPEGLKPTAVKACFEEEQKTGSRFTDFKCVMSGSIAP